jgi:hypothetical protein
LVFRNDILLQFYLDPERVARTHDPNWEPFATVRFRRDVSRLRKDKLRIVDLEFDNTLWMPTRLRLQETDLLVCTQRAHLRIEAFNGPGPSMLPHGHPPCPWRWCPVIAFAVNALWWALPAAAESGEQSMILGDNGDLVFRVEGPNAEVQSWDGGVPIEPNQSGRKPLKATVALADLVEAWEAFSEEVRTQFLDVLPELVDNEEYGPWIREGLDYLRLHPL